MVKRDDVGGPFLTLKRLHGSIQYQLKECLQLEQRPEGAVVGALTSDLKVRSLIFVHCHCTKE